MTEKEKNYLYELRDNYLTALNAISIDFVGERALSDSDYISDSFTEYADSAISIYYKDQHDYYMENTEECERALLELYDPDSIADIIKKQGLYYLDCKAGAVGAFVKNENDLYEDQNGITKILIIDYCLNCDIYLTEEQIEEIASQDLNRWDDYADLVNESIKEE